MQESSGGPEIGAALCERRCTTPAVTDRTLQPASFCVSAYGSRWAASTIEAPSLVKQFHRLQSLTPPIIFPLVFKAWVTECADRNNALKISARWGGFYADFVFVLTANDTAADMNTFTPGMHVKVRVTFRE
jgi:hypothetical protein